MKTRFALLSTCALMLIAAASARAQNSFTVTPIQYTTVFTPPIVNNLGQMAGTLNLSAFNPNGNNVYHAFFWDDSRTFHDLGTLPGGTFSRATGINNKGQVTGYSETRTTAGAAVVTHGFLWDAAHGMRDIGILPGITAARASQPSAINDNAQIVGTTADAQFQVRPFVWDSVHGMQNIGASLPYGSAAYANDINNNGAVVGTGFYWDAAHGLQDIHTVTGQPYFGSSVVFINDSGRIASQLWVGSTANGDTSSPLYEAAFWDPKIGFRRIAPGQSQSSVGCLALNNKGQVIARLPGGLFFYDDAAGLRALNDMLPGNSGWTIVDAFSLNDSSQITAQAIQIVNGEPVYAYVLLNPSSAVLPVTPSLLTLSTAGLNAGSSATGTVTLTRPAPAGGAVVALASSSAYVLPPAAVTIAAGAATANFTLTTKAPPDGTPVLNVTITATLNAVSRTAGFQFYPIYAQQATANPSSVVGGNSSVVTLLLSGPAPTGGVKIQMSSDTPNATLPATITIPQGASSATITVKTSAVRKSLYATLTFFHPVQSAIAYLQILAR